MKFESDFESHSPNEPSEKPTDSDVIDRRVETLVDGVFAIVLTLLILDIKAPDAASDLELTQRLFTLAPKFFAYVLSFVVLGLFWFGHQMMSRYIRRADRVHIWLSLLFLMCIAFVPFSAALLGQHGQYRSATILYGINAAAAGLVRYLHWRYATGNHRLIDKELSPKLIRSISRTFLVAPIACTVGIGVSFFSVPVSLALYTMSLVLGGMGINAVPHHAHQHDR